MNFSQFTPTAVWTGLAAIAVGLYLLQRLRVRFQQVDIVTTLFWRQAQEENRTRVLTQRFRHPWIYLFLLAIAALLWFAAAGINWQREGERDYLLVLDGSLAMTEDALWQQAVESVQQDAADLPISQRQVWLAQSPPLLLLQKGEHERLLGERLNLQQAKNQSSQLASLLHRHAANPQRRTPTQVRLYGQSRLSEEDSQLLPTDFELVYRNPLLHLAENRGILTASWHESKSGQWDRVDFAATVLGEIEPWQLQLNQKAWQTAPQLLSNDDGSTTLCFRDLPADGGNLLLTLPGDDGLAADNQYSCTLPSRQVINVAISEDLASSLSGVIEADPALNQVSAGEADVLISSDTNASSALPQLLFTTAASSHAIHVQSASFANAEQLLNQAVPALGVAQIDGLALAESLQREVSLGATASGTPQIQLWRALLNPEHGFVHSQSFPQFLSRSVRWLHQPKAMSSADQVSTNGLSGQTAASQLDAAATLRLAQPVASAEVPDPLTESRRWPMWRLLILLVIALLFLEWAWFQQGRLP